MDTFSKERESTMVPKKEESISAYLKNRPIGSPRGSVGLHPFFSFVQQFQHTTGSGKGQMILPAPTGSGTSPPGEKEDPQLLLLFHFFFLLLLQRHHHVTQPPCIQKEASEAAGRSKPYTGAVVAPPLPTSHCTTQ